ncbi:MAG: bifunctional (p)ppGpp synthetase/guanosine-3',5'-bis(diphosphate) 3'-pyrophosphohydrolase [Oscillospiraceae bacterium]|nr:bifunctional (p)ppGpp synthetase/guanosine-3',5'-bis(diphosphate) 3'-pyrophosphohydrolase [Oscillospiraceae bacterium]
MESVEVRYNAMAEAIRKHTPYVDMELVDAAFHYAEEKHKEQKRKDGSPYIIHPLAVAEIVAEMGLDTESILAALLHDCIEDTDSSYDDIAKRFGKPVADLVEGVTKLTRVNFQSLEEKQMENLRKMFLAMSKDIRVILIKIADRLHNARTFQFQSPEKQRSKSLETMEIYAPLAHRLGMQKIKWELEDISLKYLDPIGYAEISQQLDEREMANATMMASIRDKIENRLNASGIKFKMYGRVKHIYSVYRKMYTQNKTMDEVYDLYAFRVIVDDIADCYNVLGHIHDLYNLVPGRFKDYISTPKPNGYQSLHTTVIGSEGIPFEVQIRTAQMHHTAEYGIAAHWKYKEGVRDNGGEEQFEWVRRLLENQQDTEAEDFISSLKIDMFDDEVFVFTPKGQVISLPSGATPIDFAYAIHSEVGNHMVGAKVNARIVNYDTVLQNGDIVEVITSKSAKGPSRDWLSLCKSNQARIKIKQWYKKERREENIVNGKQSFDEELRRIGISPSVITNEQLLPNILKKVSFANLDDMYAAIGYGGLTAVKAVNRIKEEILRYTKSIAKDAEDSSKDVTSISRPTKQATSGVVVEDIDNCMIKFARCCTPVPGDDIVGFITKGFGVSVHRRDCPNAAGAASPNNDGRWVKVAWAAMPMESFSTSFELTCRDRDGIALDVAMALSAMKLRCSELNARSDGKGGCTISITVEVRNVGEMNQIRNRLASIKGVESTRRGHH